MVRPSSGARTVPRPFVSLVPRCAVVAVLALALGLAACGRKGALDPPPGAAAAELPAVPGTPPATAAGADTRAAAPAGTDGQAAAPAVPKKRLPIDWLLD
jgi:predicted small lipoprotein YifL